MSARRLPADTMRRLLSARFAQVGTPFLALIFTSHLLLDSEIKVLLALLLHVNWNPARQGGHPATWVTIEGITRDTGLSEGTVLRALKRLGVDGQRVRAKGGGTVDLVALGIFREANEAEKAEVLAGRKSRVGAPSTVRIAQDPSLWTLPRDKRREFLSLLPPEVRRDIWPEGTESWENGVSGLL